MYFGASSAVQRLGLCSPNAGDMSSILAWGTKILHAAWAAKNKKQTTFKVCIFGFHRDIRSDETGIISSNGTSRQRPGAAAASASPVFRSHQPSCCITLGPDPSDLTLGNAFVSVPAGNSSHPEIERVSTESCTKGGYQRGEQGQEESTRDGDTEASV